MNEKTQIIKPLNPELLSIALDNSSESIKSNAIAISKGVTAVTDPNSRNAAVAALRQVKGLIAAVEASRTEVKAPVLDLGRKIDQLAKDFSADLESESRRLNKLISDFEAEQLRIAHEAEAARQAELRRIEAEKRRLVEEAAALERKRLREAAEKRALEALQNTAQPIPEPLAPPQMTTQEVVTRAKIAELTQDQVKVATAVVAAPEKAPGQSVRTVPKFEITNIHELYRSNPALVRLEAKTNEINAVLKTGIKTIPGLRIWDEVVTNVR